MLEKHFRLFKVPMPIETWHRLPRNGAYKYEYINGQAVIEPRPHCQDVVLDLEAFRAPETDGWEKWEVRPLLEQDWAGLPRLMASAFYGVAPFSTFNEEEMAAAVADCVKTTRGGGDGELLPEACRVLTGRWMGEGAPQGMGAALVTLIRHEVVEGVVPLLTWIFILPLMKRRGGGVELLSAVVAALRAMGHRKLVSVVCTGNHASMAWHWHMGFVMGPTIREKVRARRD